MVDAFPQPVAQGRQLRSRRGKPIGIDPASEISPPRYTGSHRHWQDRQHGGAQGNRDDDDPPESAVFGQKRRAQIMAKNATL